MVFCLFQQTRQQKLGAKTDPLDGPVEQKSNTKLRTYPGCGVFFCGGWFTVFTGGVDSHLRKVEFFMKMNNLLLVTGIVSTIGILIMLPEAAGAEERSYVFKSDGSKQCESDSGVDLATMSKELITVGIKVYSQKKGHDGREGIALCGAPTGQINIYEIVSDDLAQAVKKGFEKLP